jgi:hypothetical protein
LADRGILAAGGVERRQPHRSDLRRARRRRVHEELVAGLFLVVALLVTLLLLGLQWLHSGSSSLSSASAIHLTPTYGGLL